MIWRGRLKVALAPVVAVLALKVVFYYDHQMRVMCPLCANSSTYEQMQALMLAGVIMPLTVLLHYLLRER